MNVLGNTKGQILLRALVGLVLIGMILALSVSGEKGQPIAFNHRKHIENNVSCQVCHPLYTNSAKAGLPGVETCRQCHENVVYISSEMSKLLQYVNAHEEIPWRQIYNVPGHVFFSHERHVGLGKLDCSHCHGAVELATAPLSKPAVKLDMDGCISCHRRSYNNPNECIMCHR